MMTINIVPDYLNGQPYEHQHEDARLITGGNGWFFHGELDFDLGYDKGRILDLPEEYTIKQYYPSKDKFKVHSNLNGIFKCNVEGIPYECIAYLYTIEENGYYYQKGYVCKSTDHEAIKDAKRYLWENLNDKILNDPKVGIRLYFKYSKTPWITSEELANIVKQDIYGKD